MSYLFFIYIKNTVKIINLLQLVKLRISKLYSNYI